MTGQVKEEILGRWMELGLDIDDGKAVFAPSYLEKKDFNDNDEITFSWCGTKIVYDRNHKKAMTVTFTNGETRTFDSSVLPKKESALLFARSKAIAEIRIAVV